MDDPPTFIPVKDWVTFAIHPRGEDIEIAFHDEAGKAYIFRLPPTALGVLFMNIPRMIDIALQRFSGDIRTRHVFALGEWAVEEAVSGAVTTLTLGTTDGFKVSFATSTADARKLGTAIRKGSGCRISEDPTVPVRH